MQNIPLASGCDWRAGGVGGGGEGGGGDGKGGGGDVRCVFRYLAGVGPGLPGGGGYWWGGWSDLAHHNTQHIFSW